LLGVTFRAVVSGNNRHSVGALLAAVVSVGRAAGVSTEALRRHEAALVDRALLHRVPGPVAAAYRSRGLEVPERLRSSQIEASVSRMTALHDLDFMSGVLAAHDVEFLTFKGQVLTTLVGGDDWERPTLDLDVLVQGAQLEKAVDLLVGRGAAHLDLNWPRMRDDVLGELHLVLPSGTALDLHWHLLVRSSTRSAFAPDHPALFANSRTIDLDGSAVRTFGPAETLVYSCLHGAISGGHRLVWLVDIERLVANDQPDWDEVVRVVSSWRCGLVVGAMLLRTRAELGLEVPQAVVEQLVPSRGMRLAMEAVDRVRSVGDVTGDGPGLRLVTRSLDVDTSSTLRSLFARPAKRAYGAVTRRRRSTAADLFLDVSGGDLRNIHRAEYFAAVRAAAD
jgi:Uncharacterised nucleotidyltransferase